MDKDEFEALLDVWQAKTREHADLVDQAIRQIRLAVRDPNDPVWRVYRATEIERVLNGGGRIPFSR